MFLQKVDNTSQFHMLLIPNQLTYSIITSTFGSLHFGLFSEAILFNPLWSRILLLFTPVNVTYNVIAIVSVFFIYFFAELIIYMNRLHINSNLYTFEIFYIFSFKSKTSTCQIPDFWK